MLEFLILWGMIGCVAFSLIALAIPEPNFKVKVALLLAGGPLIWLVTITVYLVVVHISREA